MPIAQPRLEHANIVVADIAPTLAFLKAAFPDWRVRGEGVGDWYGKPRRWLHFGDENNYITLNDNGDGPWRDLQAHQSGLAHIGFEVPSLGTVQENLERAGFKISHHGEDHPHRRNLYFIDDSGLEFEFTEYFSDAADEKNHYQTR